MFVGAARCANEKRRTVHAVARQEPQLRCTADVLHEPMPARLTRPTARISRRRVAPDPSERGAVGGRLHALVRRISAKVFSAVLEFAPSTEGSIRLFRRFLRIASCSLLFSWRA